MIDRKKFFDGVRSSPFPGEISAAAVVSMNAVLDEWERRKLTRLEWLAYMLATILAECGRNMTPVREGFKHSDAEARAYVHSKGYRYAKEIDGHVWYGRGLVQLTWRDNYVKMGKALGINLVGNPDLALDPKVAVQVLFEGMLNAKTGVGDFTGKSLETYTTPTGFDWVNARRIINGTDRAAEIASYGKQFYADLKAAEVPGVPKNAVDAVIVAGGGTIVGGAAKATGFDAGAAVFIGILFAVTLLAVVAYMRMRTP